jgi:hypothetical protein
VDAEAAATAASSLRAAADLRAWTG